jgi:hypothetical protein
MGYEMLRQVMSCLAATLTPSPVLDFWTVEDAGPYKFRFFELLVVETIGLTVDAMLCIAGKADFSMRLRLSRNDRGFR